METGNLYREIDICIIIDWAWIKNLIFQIAQSF